MQSWNFSFKERLVSFQNVETFVLTIFFICYVHELIAKHQRPLLASLYEVNTQWSVD